jgi:multidrug resistance protein
VPAIHRPIGDRAVLALLFTMMFTSGTEAMIMTPVLPQLAAELGVSIELAGLWVTGYVAAVGVSALIFGPISDHYGRRLMLIYGTAAVTIGTLLCALAGSYATLLAARTFAGAGAGLLVTSTTSYVGDHFPQERRAEAMSHVMNGGLLAMILGAPLGAFFASALGWRMMFVLISALLFATFILLYLRLPEPRHATKSTALTARAALGNYLGLFAVRPLRGFFAMSAINGLSMTMYAVYLSPWMAEHFGFETHHRGLVYAIGGPAVLIASPIAGKLAGQYGRVPIVLTGTAMVAVTIVIMPFTRAIGAALESALGLGGGAFRVGDVGWAATIPLFAGALFVLMGGATRSGPLHTFAHERIASAQRGSLAAAGNCFFQIGSAFGAGLGGLIWALTGGGFHVICFATAALNVLAGALLWTLADARRSSV